MNVGRTNLRLCPLLAQQSQSRCRFAPLSQEQSLYISDDTTRAFYELDIQLDIHTVALVDIIDSGCLCITFA